MSTPEELARQNIDALLQQCGWVIQNYKQLDSTSCEQWSERDERHARWVGLATREERRSGERVGRRANESFVEARPRALIQMATGAGKTLTACAFTYRLIKHAGARNVLFLVDRANLGRQAMAEFQQFVTPDGRKFTELYNVQHLTSNKLEGVCRGTICSIQRLYPMLRSLFSWLNKRSRRVSSREETVSASCEFNEACGSRPLGVRPLRLIMSAHSCTFCRNFPLQPYDTRR